MTMIPYWQPGKSYQPNALVQANENAAITQTALTNASFESGDSGWTKGSRFSIVNTAGFIGSWRAEYAADTGLLAAIATDSLNVPAFSSDGTSWTDASNTVSGLLLAANDSVFVATNFSTLETSLDADNWTVQSAPSNWNGLKEFTVWLPAAELFMCARSNSTVYHTSADGVTWTERAFPETFTNTASTSQASVASNGTTDVLLLTDGRIFYTTTGTSWTEATGSPVWGTVGTGLAYHDTEGAFFACGTDSAVLTLYSSTDGITWVEVASNDLDATITGAPRLAYNPDSGVLCAKVNITGTTATTTTAAVSPDGVTWTLVNSYGGYYMRYSPAVGGFVTFGYSGSNSNLMAYSNAAGTSWTQIAYAGTATEKVTYPSADRSATSALQTLVNDDRRSVFAGQIITASAKVQTSATGTALIGIAWYDGSNALIKIDYGNALTGASSNWREINVSALAPADAATATAVLAGSGTGSVLFDDVKWDYFAQAEKSGLIFKATQAGAGFSGSSEPAWPTSVSGTVVDNEVTWTAIAANCIVWKAVPHLLTGSSEPTWPTEEGATVLDNTILWTAESGRVKDINCPNTKQVAIAASKIFAADDDIVAYSATVNPLDWSALDDAGFIPFGLNTYGSEPVSALGIYRSNLVVFNSKAFQMWQVDEDPQNFALLDAVPVGCPYFKSLSPVSNDLVFLSGEGIRSMGIAGASTNLQAGFFGKQIDPLVKAALAAAADVDDIISLYFPGAGQYWLIFDDEAFVLTMNGGTNDMSWSRYVFPSAIDDWSISGKDLYLRSGNKVWKFDSNTLRDDEGGANVQFVGKVWWPYLDFGALGEDKSMEGFDVVADGTFSVSFGYNQKDDAQFTTPYTIAGDTLTGDMIPMPLTAPSFQMRLEFAGNEAWEWSASALYL